MDGGALGATARGRFVAAAGYPVLAVAGALIIVGLLVAAAGKNPAAAFGVFVAGTFGSLDGWLEILVRAIPLTLVGLGIAVAFRARIFNVGGDGQLIVGAMTAVAAAQALPELSGWLLVPVFLVAGALGGAAWGGIAGYLRARFNANEIIVTIMLNYVAVQLLSWAIRGPMQESMKVFPRSDAIPQAVTFDALIEGSRLHAGLIIALIAAVILYVVLRRSRFGFALDAVGESRPAARYGGIDDRRVILLAMLVSGGLAGLAGAVEIAGIQGRLQDDFAPGVGITAIAVALIARLNPFLVPLAALLFGILSVGAGALQRELGIPFPLLQVVEGIVILGFLIVTYLRSRGAGGAMTAARD